MSKRNTGNSGRKPTNGDSIRNPNDSNKFQIPPLDQLLGSMPMGSSDEDIASGKGFSNTDRFQFQYELGKIRDERQWQEDMFNQYQSIPAQVRQMQEAGLNPALMYQSGASPGTMSSTGASDGSPVNTSGRTPMRAIDKASSILQMLTGLGSVASNMGKSVSDIIRNREMNTLTQAQAASEQARKENIEQDTKLKAEQEYKTRIERIGLEYDNVDKAVHARYADLFARLQINQGKETIELLHQQARHFEKQVKVASEQIELLKEQTSESEMRQFLYAIQNRLTSLQADQLEAILPFAERAEQARVDLLEAQDDETMNRAVLNIRQADKVFWENFMLSNMNDESKVDTPLWKLLYQEQEGKTKEQSQKWWLDQVREGKDIASVILNFVAKGL